MLKSGYPKDWFVGSHDELADFICPFCMDICRDAQQCKNSHLFCCYCVTKAHMKNIKCCPTCRTGKLTSEHIHNNVFARKEILRLFVRCICYSPESAGCGWTGPLSTREDRDKSCPVIREISTTLRAGCHLVSPSPSVTSETNDCSLNPFKSEGLFKSDNEVENSVVSGTTSLSGSEKVVQRSKIVDPQESIVPLGKTIELLDSQRILNSGSSSQPRCDFDLCGIQDRSRVSTENVVDLSLDIASDCDVICSDSSNSGSVCGIGSGDGLNNPMIRSISSALRSPLNVLTTTSRTSSCDGDLITTALHSDDSSQRRGRTSDASHAQSRLSSPVDTDTSQNMRRLQTASTDANPLGSRALILLRDNTSTSLTQIASSTQMTVVSPKNGDETALSTIDSQVATVVTKLTTCAKRKHTEVIDLTDETTTSDQQTSKHSSRDSVSVVERSVMQQSDIVLHNIREDERVVNDDLPTTAVTTPSNAQFAFPGYDGQFNSLGERHGEGLMEFTSGTDSSGVYVGMWEGGMRCGEGIMEYSNGDLYEGRWKSDKRHGEGSLTSSNGVRYIGEWVSDHMHGIGRLLLPDGSEYEGELKGGKWHDHGRLTFPFNSTCGVVFEGCFVNGAMCGHGVMEYANGEVYVGEWYADQRHGQGVLWDDDRKVYEGGWIHDQYCGEGQIWLACGNIYKGQFTNSTFNGMGIMKYACGPDAGGEYHGSWVGGMRCGEGYMEYCNADIYCGSWIEDERSGQGKMVYISGQTYKGAWVGNVRHGFGSLTQSNDDHIEGEWRNDIMIQGVKMYVNSGAVYTGPFLNNKRHGHGVLTIKSQGYAYNGEWRIDLRNGDAKCTTIAGDSYEGQFRDDVMSGNGVLKFADGRFYKGDFVNGHFQGRGVLTFINGDQYEGHFTEGRIEGVGVMIHFDRNSGGAEWTDDGHFMNGKLSGFNKRTNSDGSMMEGVWFDNSRAKVKGTSVNGDEYEGDLVNGVFSGHGTMSYKGGEKFSGGWLNSKRHGVGTFTTAASDEYIGQYVNDLKHGEGKMTYVDGSVYDGEWEAGVKKGDCEYTFVSGDRYYGTWDGGGAHGDGVMWYATGNRYVGEWSKGLRHGDGHMTYSESTEGCCERSYKGEFFDGVRSGHGTETSDDGSIYTGDWLHDARHGEGELRAAPIREGCQGKLIYKGHWAGGTYQGLGKVHLPGGDAFKGMFLNGLFHGSGTFFQNGNKYFARWKAGKVAKKGKKLLTYTDGSTYSGLWCTEKGRHGLGQFKNIQTGCVFTGVFNHDLLSTGKVQYPTGGSYEDSFHNFKRHGWGTYSNEDNDLERVGWWCKDVYQNKKLGVIRQCSNITLNLFLQLLQT